MKKERQGQRTMKTAKQAIAACANSLKGIFLIRLLQLFWLVRVDDWIRSSFDVNRAVERVLILLRCNLSLLCGGSFVQIVGCHNGTF